MHLKLIKLRKAKIQNKIQLQIGEKTIQNQNQNQNQNISIKE